MIIRACLQANRTGLGIPHFFVAKIYSVNSRLFFTETTGLLIIEGDHFILVANDHLFSRTSPSKRVKV